MRIDLVYGNDPFRAAVSDAYVDREERKGSLYPFISTVTFAPEDNITRYDINSVPEGAKKSMNDLTKLNKLRVGELYLIGGKTNWK